ncbi:hypothetical protein JCM10449v2_008027 [Rhodotorula kratochvilovae]
MEEQREHHPDSAAYKTAERVCKSNAYLRENETDSAGRDALGAYTVQHHKNLLFQLDPMHPHLVANVVAAAQSRTSPAPARTAEYAQTQVLVRNLLPRGRKEARGSHRRASRMREEHRAPHLDEEEEKALGKGGVREGGFRRGLLYFGRRY